MSGSRSWQRRCVFLLAIAAGAAQAGRPLATDDATTLNDRLCQLEAWVDKGDGERLVNVAPACAIASGTEVDIGFVRATPHRDPLAEISVALKWVPSFAEISTGIGTFRFGLKLGVGGAHPADGRWRRTGAGVLGIASWEASPHLALHVNVGLQFDRDADLTRTHLNVAVAATPIARLQLFAEVLTSDHRTDENSTERSLGARWWLAQDKFGIDLTGTRSAAPGTPTRWGIGFGWYGLDL